MAANDSKRYYWLKLHNDFFKRHDITIVEGMENGKDYILFYLKLLVESISHEGRLRFSDLIPYNEQMLSTLTSTNIDVVRSAMRIFRELQMIDILDDGTLYMQGIQSMIGSETGKAERMREYRERIATSGLQQGYNVAKSIENRDKSKEKERISKDIPKKNSKFIPPTLEEVETYCKERKNNVDAKKFMDYYTTSDWKDAKGNKVKNWKQKVITWEGRRNNLPDFELPISNEKEEKEFSWDD